MRDFAAIDFETANEQPSSVCSVGIVIVRDGEIVDSFYSLIHPEPEYYQWFCQRVHGLSRKDTEDAPVFPYVWEKIEPLIEGLPLVAHNSRFDEGCLKAVFRVYQMDYPDYEFYDTLAASRRYFGRSLPNHQLQTVAAACGYDLVNHHHALADAEACAQIAIKLFCNAVIRVIRPDEISLLDTFLYEAIFVPEGVPKPDRSIIYDDELYLYVKEFGLRPDDRCMVAELDGRIIGAVWTRIIDDYGHIDDQTPSLAISILEGYRGHGYGKQLLSNMIELLRTDGYQRVSLSVQKQNYATNLYLKLGFEVIEDKGDEVIMCLCI